MFDGGWKFPDEHKMFAQMQAIYGLQKELLAISRN